MVTLTEDMIIARTKISNLESITKLNFCSRELSDVSILQKMKNVTVLSLSVNNIDSLEVFQFLTKLEDLFLRKNNIVDLNQVCYLQGLPDLQNLCLQDNPCAANDEEYRLAVIRALPRLKKLDNTAVESSELDRALRLGRPLANPNLLEENYSGSDEEEQYYTQQIKEIGEDRSPSPEDDYRPPRHIYQPEERPTLQGSTRPKEYNNSYEVASKENIYTNDVEDPREVYGGELPANHAYMNHRTQPPAPGGPQQPGGGPPPAASAAAVPPPAAPAPQPPPVYSKYEDEIPPAQQRQQNHRQQMLPRSRTTDGELGCHFSCPNFCSVAATGHRRPNERRTNVLNAVLCLLKELDYPNLEVVQMAVKCRMEEILDTSYSTNNNSS